MKKDNSMERIPNFASEREEADWWDAHPEALTQRFQAAKRDGRLKRLSQTELPGAGETATLRLHPEELARAREFAAKRGLSYQAYMETLVHEALNHEEKLLAS
jgi:predicted DNA binding CopG/RHH family protein